MIFFTLFVNLLLHGAQDEQLEAFTPHDIINATFSQKGYVTFMKKKPCITESRTMYDWEDFLEKVPPNNDNRWLQLKMAGDICSIKLIKRASDFITKESLELSELDQQYLALLPTYLKKRLIKDARKNHYPNLNEELMTIEKNLRTFWCPE